MNNCTCGPKQIWNSQAKNTSRPEHFWEPGAQKCTPPDRCGEAHFEIKSVKNWSIRSSLGSRDVQKVDGIVVWGRLHYLTLKMHCSSTLQCITLHYIRVYYSALHCILTILLQSYSALQYITVHDSTVHYINLHGIALRCITFALHLYSIASHCITDSKLHCVAFHYVTLRYITLPYITLMHYLTLSYITVEHSTSEYVRIDYIAMGYVALD